MRRPRLRSLSPRRACALALIALVGLAGVVAPRMALAQPASSTKVPEANDPANQPTLSDDRAVIEAGQKWLKLLDDGKFDYSWDVSSNVLKQAVTRDKWTTGMRDLRKPYGKLVSRTAEKFARAHSMPGAPDGDYAIIIYSTTFANQKHADEQLTWALDEDGTWRVSGYYIR